MHHCLPYGGPVPYTRTSELNSTQALRQVLDVRTKARAFDGTSALGHQLLEGTTPVHWLFRNVVYIASTPIRMVLILIYGVGQLVCECPRHGLGDQPRVIQRITGQTLLTAIMTLGSYIQPFIYPHANVRTLNIADLRSASVYSQADIPRAAVAGLFGWLPSSHVSSDLSPSKMAGLCWGKTLWMAAMHLHGKSPGSDPSQRLRAIARTYQLGAPAEALLLHQIADHTSVRPGAFERLSNRVTGWLKPIGVQSFFRGVTSYVWGKNALGFMAAWTLARRTADLALKEIREQACLAALIGLRTFDTQCFRPADASRGGLAQMNCYAGIGSMADGTYLVTTESDTADERHAVLYVRSEQGKKGVFYDPNVGLELGHEGKDHWQALVGIASRSHHNVISLTRVEKRRLWDLGRLDVRRRFAELWC